jgi:basic membrane protein A
MKRLLPLLLAAFLAIPAANVAQGRRQLRVGYLEWAGTRNGPGISQDTYIGFVRAVKDFGLQGAVHDVGPRDSVVDGIAYFVRQKYDLIVTATINPNIEQIIDAVVKRFPRTRLLLPDVAAAQVPARWRNVRGFGFRIEQASYLAGYLGALVEKRHVGRHVISSVGGVPEPQLDPFIAGYQAGARKADPTVTTLNDYSYDFNAPRKCRAVVLAQIARGSGVVFDVAGACGLGALEAARAKGIWGVGVDVDQSFLGPYILTSVLKNESRALYLELEAFTHGRLPASGYSRFGVREGAVGLGKISPRVPRSLVPQLDRIRVAIASGRIRVPSRLS